MSQNRRRTHQPIGLGTNYPHSPEHPASTPAIQKSPHHDKKTTKSSSSQLPFSNSKTVSKTTTKSNNKTQNKTQQTKQTHNLKCCTHKQDMSAPQPWMPQTEPKQIQEQKQQIPSRNQNPSNPRRNLSECYLGSQCWTNFLSVCSSCIR